MRETALLLVSDLCGGSAATVPQAPLHRRCARGNLRRLGGLPTSATTRITNVLLTGATLWSSGPTGCAIYSTTSGDQARRIIRIGTKMLATRSVRIINDPALVDADPGCYDGENLVYIMAQFNHPRGHDRCGVPGDSAPAGCGSGHRTRRPDPRYQRRPGGAVSFSGGSRSSGQPLLRLPVPADDRERTFACGGGVLPYIRAGAGDLFGALEAGAVCHVPCDGKIEVVGKTGGFT